jgi:hypothetical protein
MGSPDFAEADFFGTAENLTPPALAEKMRPLRGQQNWQT